MTTETHSQLASFIWSICNLLRGPYKRNEYRKVILPLTVLRRFDCILAPTKAQVLKEHTAIKTKGENIIRHRLSQISSVPFFNLSKFTMAKPVQGSGSWLSLLMIACAVLTCIRSALERDWIIGSSLGSFCRRNSLVGPFWSPTELRCPKLTATP